MTPVDLSALTDHSELQDIVACYGHGDCTDLAAYLSETYGLSPVWVVGMKTGMPVHVFVQIGSLALDAYGISPLSTVMARYAPLIKDNLGEMAAFQLQERSQFLQNYRCERDDFDDAQASFQWMLPHLGVDHEWLVQEGDRQMAQSFVGNHRFQAV